MKIKTKMSTLWSVVVHSVGINNNGLVSNIDCTGVCSLVKICGVCARTRGELKQLLQWYYNDNYNVLLKISGIIPYNKLHE